MKCSYCNSEISMEDLFCGICGQKINKASESISINDYRKDSEFNKEKKKDSFFDKYKLKNISLNKAGKYVKNACIAGIISIGITALMLLFNVIDSIYWIDLILFTLLLFGLYKKNTFSAVIIFIYFLIGKVIQFSEVDKISLPAIILAFIFLHYFYLGILGVVKHNKLVKKKRSATKNLIFGIVIGVLAVIFLGYLAFMFIEPYINEDYLAPLSQEQISAIVMLVCPSDYDTEYISFGSGVIMNPETGNIITNRHVVTNEDGSIIGSSPTCFVGITEDISQPPKLKYLADLVAYSPETKMDEEYDFDIAVLYIYDVCSRDICEEAPLALPLNFPYLDAGYSEELVLGSYVSIAGYPESGGGTFNFTEGIISGKLGNFVLKTDAKIDLGNSGGAALNEYNQLIGIPTWTISGEIEAMGYIIGIDAIYDWYEKRVVPSESTIVPFE